MAHHKVKLRNQIEKFELEDLHAIIHAPFEKLGIIESWVSIKKYTLSVTHTYNGKYYWKPRY